MSAAAAGRRGRSAMPVWLQVALGLGFVLAVVATVLVIVSDDPRWLRLAALGALWAALLAALAFARARRDARTAEVKQRESQHTYELELLREVSARREFEVRYTEEVRQQVQDGQREELAAIRDQLDRLGSTLSGLLDGDVLVERLTLSAESTRIRQLGEPGRPRFVTESVPGSPRPILGGPLLQATGQVVDPPTAHPVGPPTAHPAGATTPQVAAPADQPGLATDHPVGLPTDHPVGPPSAPTWAPPSAASGSSVEPGSPPAAESGVIPVGGAATLRPAPPFPRPAGRPVSATPAAGPPGARPGIPTGGRPATSPTARRTGAAAGAEPSIRPAAGWVVPESVAGPRRAPGQAATPPPNPVRQVPTDRQESQEAVGHREDIQPRAGHHEAIETQDDSGASSATAHTAPVHTEVSQSAAPVDTDDELTAHSAGVSVADMLAAFGTQPPRPGRRRRAADDEAD